MTEEPEPGVRRRRRGPFLLVGLLLVLGLAAAGAWIALRGLSAKDDLDAARGQLEAARTALLDRRIDECQAAITAAGERTEAARDKTGDPLWRLAAAVPVLGNSLEVTRGLTAGVDDIARQVLPTALATAEDLDPKALRRDDGSIDLTLLRKVTPGVRESAAGARAAEERLLGLDHSALVPQVAAARLEVLQAAADLRSALEGAAEGIGIAPALLGQDKPRRYLMIVQQTSESRGTGGLPGGFAEIVARAGRLDVVSQGSNTDLKNGNVPAPAGVDAAFRGRYRDFGSFDLWQNVNVSPDLPVVARLIESRWRAQGGAALDGVVMVDAKALASILAGSGPLDVGGGRKVLPEALEDYLAIGQYEGLSIDDQSVRKERLQQVATEALGRVTRGGGDSVALLRGVSSAVSSGHLRMASRDPVLAPVLQRTGVDASLPRGPAPVAYPVVFNGTGGKLDYFLDREVRYEAGACGGDRRRSVITTTLTSQVPSTPLPPYVTLRLNAGRESQSTTNSLGVMVYGTRGAKLLAATVDGKPVSSMLGRTDPLLEQGEEAGLPVWLVYLDLEPGKSRTFALELDEPRAAGEVRIPQQPLARALVRQVSAPTCR